MTVHLQFPKDYPQKAILVELKSKTLSDKLLSKLVDVCDQELKKYIGKQQVNIKSLEYVLRCAVLQNECVVPQLGGSFSKF